MYSVVTNFFARVALICRRCTV